MRQNRNVNIRAKVDPEFCSDVRNESIQEKLPVTDVLTSLCESSRLCVLPKSHVSEGEKQREGTAVH